MRPPQKEQRNREFKEPWYTKSLGKKRGYVYNVNPYLFLLLKRMLQFEIALFFKEKGGNPTRDVLRGEATSFLTEKVDGTFARRIEKEVWNSPAFCVRLKDLDQLCRLIHSFGKFESWSAFTEFYGLHPYAKIAEDYCGEYFIDLAKSDRDRIIRCVNISDSLFAGTVFDAYTSKGNGSNIIDVNILLKHFEIISTSDNAYVSHYISNRDYSDIQIGSNELKNLVCEMFSSLKDDTVSVSAIKEALQGENTLVPKQLSALVLETINRCREDIRRTVDMELTAYDPNGPGHNDLWVLGQGLEGTGLSKYF